MSYHETIINLLHYILSQSQEFVDNLNKGNAFDKIVRNYHQFNLKGEKVYRSLKKGLLYYQYSESAYKNRKNRTKLYYEHTKPVKLIKTELFELIHSDLTEESFKSKIKEILSSTDIVVITKGEAKSLDEKFKDTLPDNNSRLDELNIKIHSKTVNNCIFKKLGKDG